MVDFFITNGERVIQFIFLAIVLALFFAPFETMGWWAGWWFDSDEEKDIIGEFRRVTSHPDDTQRMVGSKYEHYVVFLTGIGGSSTHVDVPMEARFLERLREFMPEAMVVDHIYPYSVANRSLTDDRLMARFWRWTLRQKETGRRALGFSINLRNIFQLLVVADDRYGPFFARGAAKVIFDNLIKAGYPLDSEIPVTIIGYSGGGQISVATAPYLAQILKGTVQVISLGGVLNSTPVVNRIDHVTHIYGDKDSVQRLGLWFPGRWRIAYFSSWNQGRRSGRITTVPIGNMAHDGPGGYLDEGSFLPDGTSFLEHTVETIGELIRQPIEPIEDEGIFNFR